MRPTTLPTDLSAALPLSESTFLILVSLSGGPRHGYAIMKEVEELSQGRVMLSTGTLYGAIKRLLADDWIRRVEEPAGETGARGRKSYTLTALGRRVLAAETQVPSRRAEELDLAAVHPVVDRLEVGGTDLGNLRSGKQVVGMHGVLRVWK